VCLPVREVGTKGERKGGGGWGGLLRGHMHDDTFIQTHFITVCVVQGAGLRFEATIFGTIVAVDRFFEMAASLADPKWMPPSKELPKRDLSTTQLRFAATHPGWGETPPIRFKSDGAKT